MRWKSSGRESRLQAMNCSGDAIVIPERGHYYIYSQVSFVGGGCENGSEVLENTLLYSAPQSRGRRQHQHQQQQHPVELMQATQTVCQGPNNKPWYHSLHQGGLHWLEKNTRISVKIRPFHRAELEHHKTFFGAFKLQ
ncbi:lymphotoxin-alpha-like [Leucoraja erinacea]|uniref:lymphotoxin-alpha-like n=1 Tax=Leucoraja erinaceus TaxID=7782 RepID=UPI0024538A98|nr:lymphotoxin-alpha-like [Leucoraja erinacea]